MTLLTAQDISKRFGDVLILKGVSFAINDDARIAIVGKNGTGKTTLLEMLAGKQSPDSGKISRAGNCVIDYIEQEKSEYLDFTLFGFVAQARSDLLQMRQRIMELEEHLALDPSNETLLRDLGELQHRFEVDGGFDFENEISSILQGLGFEPNRFQERLGNFSGGEKNRAGLARVLAGKGNLLLLDEPTNHLDIDSTIWLEEHLRQQEKACLIVSHDRAFLTATADQVWEIQDGHLETYSGGYEAYLAARSERRRLAAHHYRHQQEEIRRIEEFIRRNMAGQKTKQAQSKLKYLSRIKRLPPPKSEARTPDIDMQSSGRSWSHVLSVHDVAAGYGDRIILNEISFDLYRGDKVGLVGSNGSGKTTLLKLLIGELEPASGRVALGNNLEVAYFDQDLSDLDERATVLDNLWRLDPSAQVGTMRSYLGRFGFSGDDHLKQVSCLSGGEKTKLCLARLLYHPANLVILDEPTNHLDIYAREALEKSLSEYDGTCLLVSHDRHFLKEVADIVLYLNNGHLTAYIGGYIEFEEKVTRRLPKEARINTVPGKQQYEAFKEQSRRRAKHRKTITATRKELARLESELIAVEEDLLTNIPKNDWERLQQAAQKKHELEEQILQIYERLESLEGGKSG